MATRLDLAGGLGSADTVIVTDNLNRPLATRSDPGSLQAMRAVLAGLGDGWQVPDEAIPVAKVRLNFRRGETPIGNLGLGRTFLVAQVSGTFLRRDSDEETRTRLLEALGAEDVIPS